MIGMCRHTGKALGGIDHLMQSVGDILTTPLVSRVMRASYAGRLPRLLDAPLNEATVIEVYIATAEALRKWEPRLRLTRVSADGAAAGKLTLRLDGEYRPDGKPLSLLFRPDDRSVTLAGAAV